MITVVVPVVTLFILFILFILAISVRVADTEEIQGLEAIREAGSDARARVDQASQAYLKAASERLRTK